MKATIKAGLIALSASGVFGTAASAQTLNDLPYAPDSVANILGDRGIIFDDLEFTEPQLRDQLGASHCYDSDGNGIADTHPSGAEIRGDDNLYTFLIITGDEESDVTGVHGVTRETAYSMLEQERYAAGILFSPEGGGRIINVYSMNNGNITVARPGAIDPISQPTSAALCDDVSVSGAASPAPTFGGTK